jgi:hypothetical protein
MLMSEIEPGGHSIALELTGRRRWATAVTVAAGMRTRVAASLEEQ